MSDFSDAIKIIYQQVRDLVTEETNALLGNLVKGGKIVASAIPVDGTTVTNTGGKLSASGGGGGGGPSLLLNYVAATDLASGLATSAGVWTDVGTNQSFTKGASGTLIFISVRGVILNLGGANTGSRIVVDSGGTPITAMLGGAPNNSSNVLGGANVIALAGVSSGAHTVKVQVNTISAGTIYCRAGTLPDDEHLEIQVWEQ